ADQHHAAGPDPAAHPGRRRAVQGAHQDRPVQALSGRCRRGGAGPVERALRQPAAGARLHRGGPGRGQLPGGRMKRVISTLIVVGACAGAVVLMGAKSNSGPQTKTVKIVFDNAFGLTSGGDLKIGGVRAGKTTGFSVTNTLPPK